MMREPQAKSRSSTPRSGRLRDVAKTVRVTCQPDLTTRNDDEPSRAHVAGGHSRRCRQGIDNKAPIVTRTNNEVP